MNVPFCWRYEPPPPLEDSPAGHQRLRGCRSLAGTTLRPVLSSAASLGCGPLMGRVSAGVQHRWCCSTRWHRHCAQTAAVRGIAGEAGGGRHGRVHEYELRAWLLLRGEGTDGEASGDCSAACGMASCWPSALNKVLETWAFLRGQVRRDCLGGRGGGAMGSGHGPRSIATAGARGPFGRALLNNSAPPGGWGRPPKKIQLQDTTAAPKRYSGKGSKGLCP